MIITISGNPGSGKSSVGMEVAKRLGYEFISIGDLRGQLAKEKGITINELNKLGETEKWTDWEVDKKQAEMAKKDNIVFDARVGFHFIPKSIKVFIEVGNEVAAKRMMQTKRDDELIGKTVAEQIKLIEERIASDKKRYLKYYNIDFEEKSHYDIWIDSSHLTQEEVIKKILDFVKKENIN